MLKEFSSRSSRILQVHALQRMRPAKTEKRTIAGSALHCMMTTTLHCHQASLAWQQMWHRVVCPTTWARTKLKIILIRMEAHALDDLGGQARNRLRLRLSAGSWQNVLRRQRYNRQRQEQQGTLVGAATKGASVVGVLSVV